MVSPPNPPLPKSMQGGDDPILGLNVPVLCAIALIITKSIANYMEALI